MAVVVGGFFVYQHLGVFAANNWEQKSDEPGGWCMEMNGPTETDGVPIRTAPCDGRFQEHIYLGSPNATKLHLNGNWCLQPQNGGTASDTPIVLSACLDSRTGEDWHFSPVSGNFGEWRNDDGFKANGHAMCLTIPDGNTGATLRLRSCQRFIDQIWKQKTYVAPEGGCDGSEATASPAEAPCFDKNILTSVWGYTGSTLATQFGCIDNIYIRESGWNRFADNPSSGAYGIPQALPGSKMGPDANPPNSWAGAQMRWGASYIKSVYGTPCNAWAFWQSHGWYGPMLTPAGQQVSSPGSPDGYVGYPLFPGGLE